MTVCAVVRSSCPGFVGIEGIVVKESTNMFFVITEADELKSVPKRNNVFELVVGTGAAAWMATLYGNQLQCRPGERMVRKFKFKTTIDL